jgi:hypothetical protein
MNAPPMSPSHHVSQIGPAPAHAAAPVRTRLATPTVALSAQASAVTPE